MICVVIKGPTYEEAYRQISKAVAYADCVELRLDFFQSLDLEALKALRSHFPIPMIFTLRSSIQGGGYTDSEENRRTAIGCLIELKPEFFDLEYDLPFHFIEKIYSQFPEIKLILSYHNFEETPKDLERIYQKMRETPAFYYKIAVASKNCLETLQLICWAKKSQPHLIAISMGEHGQLSRILAPMLGYPITYASLEEDQISAPGQLSAKTLVDRYHHRSLNTRTALYGLIGDPVGLSVSDETHNSFIAFHGIDAVYVKIQVKAEELSHFLQLAKHLPFRGLSVTMPLKEKILPLLDEIDPIAEEIGAVNTLLFRDGKIAGFNTDGMGALNAIERHDQVKDKRIVLIGSGGAAKAIAYEAHQRGGLLTILNRDANKAHHIAAPFKGLGKSLDEMKTCAQDGYEILINCTPVPMPIALENILPNALVMDIKTKPKETAFLKHAMEKGCRIIYGYRMFVEQALGQFSLWFNNCFEMQKGREVLEKNVVESLSKVDNS